jgi:hypothetical protein
LSNLKILEENIIRILLYLLGKNFEKIRVWAPIQKNIIPLKTAVGVFSGFL